MTDPIDTLRLARRVATGVPLPQFTLDLEPRCTSRAEFDSIVSAYNNVLRELLVKDVRFLSRHMKVGTLREAERSVRLLRTAAQHEGNPDAKQFMAEWLDSRDGFQTAADDLAAIVQNAFAALAGAAFAAYQDPRLRSKWAEIIATKTEAVLRSVASDLGMSFRQWDFDRHQRYVDLRISSDRKSDPDVAIVREYCVQELLAQRAPLPVPYTVVLDFLGLVGDREAAGGLLAAYTVHAIAPSLRGEDFLDRVEQTWSAAARYGTGREK
jgi:hypothetical protein